MSHLEKLVIFLDNQNHVLADRNKAMMGALMKSQVETNAAISRVSDVMINVLTKMVDSNDKEVFTKEELLQRMFGPSEDSLSASHFKDLTKAMPSDDEVMQEVVFRLNELSVKDVSQPQKPILTLLRISHMLLLNLWGRISNQTSKNVKSFGPRPRSETWKKVRQLLSADSESKTGLLPSTTRSNSWSSVPDLMPSKE